MKIQLLIVFALFNALAFSQNTITGTFPDLANQQIKLVGFNGFDTYPIDSTQANEKGQFQLSFGTKDFGMAYL
ncbi:MAG TPA: hypothetical protein VJ909_08055, partial [Prolixibacteraceae bacterium]|nr:hypothetical protein [Prolixibacteraceae bacterium]